MQRAATLFGVMLAALASLAHAHLQLVIGEGGNESVSHTLATPSSPIPVVQAQWSQLDASGRLLESRNLAPELTSPLGSLWKLFVYDYLISNNIPDHPYVCKGQERDEVYCCEPGQQVSRDDALIKSCGLYFAPARLGITQAEWSRHWSSASTPAWLHQLNELQPATEVSVQSLLAVLARLPSQTHTRQVLLDRAVMAADVSGATTDSSAPVLAGSVGSRLRIKTWSWLDPADPRKRVGGFAGWLADGTPVWASGPGTSYRLLADYASALEKVLPVVQDRDPQPCVEIDLFDRYPIRSLETLAGESVQSSGALDGRYRVHFENGNSTEVIGERDLFFLAPMQGNTDSSSRPATLVARVTREEYVARVLDREAEAEPIEAAKALAIAARTYLLQNAARQGECLQIKDSSHHQRFAPRPASRAARAIAHWSSSLVLAGAPVNYHQTDAGPNRLSWQQAKDQALQGWRYDAILAAAFPRSNLASWDNPRVSCEPLPDAEHWLQSQLSRWRPMLDAQPGYQEQRQFGVCRLQAGNPHVDRQRRQIYVRALRTQQDRLDLTHEYLHLAFAAYPSGQDEHFIETLTRRLLLD
jgi:uncharacterized protein YfaQ (DUF2300 family)